MKTILSSLLFLVGSFVYAQEVPTNVSTKKEGKLIKVSTYHANGQLAQEGYLKNNRLHGKWIKYSNTGEKVCIGNYKKGKRNGTWLFWSSNDLTEVEFKNNEVLKKVAWKSDTQVVSIEK